MTQTLARFATLLLVAVLAACSGAPMTGAKSFEYVFYDYNSAVRWSEFETAWTFLDPAVRDEKPFSDEVREHYKQVQVAGYDVKSSDHSLPGEIAQSVEIRWIDKNTQTEHVMTDYQRWRWDDVDKHWWLVSGLPALEKP